VSQRADVLGGLIDRYGVGVDVAGILFGNEVVQGDLEFASS